MKMKEQYRLPNGKYTFSAKVYIREWKKIRTRLYNEFGFIVTAYDPGFYGYIEGDMTNTFSISMNVTRLLLVKIDQLNEEIELAKIPFKKGIL